MKKEFCSFKNLNVGIIGIARSGIAVAKKLKTLEANVFLSDSNTQDKIMNNSQCFNDNYTFEDFRKEFNIEFGGNSDKLLSMDLLIVSPGVPLSIKVIQNAIELGIPVWSEIEFAYRLTNKKTKIIAVTGSNGKSTTVSLINHLLVQDGYNSILAGNIGHAYSGFDIETERDFIVLELSSFQLDLIETFSPDIAVILNITPDHLNRYNSFADYAKSKFNILRNVGKRSLDSFSILNADDEMINNTLDSLIDNDKGIKNIKIKYFSQKENDAFIEDDYLVLRTKSDCLIKIDTKDTHLLGYHNKLNMLASLMAVEPFINDKTKLEDYLKTFSPLEHRLETVAIINKDDSVKNIKLVNDSKATNTDSVKYALSAFDTTDKQIHLLVGGSDKGEDFSILKPYFEKYVKKLYLIGETALHMDKVFNDIINREIYYTKDKEEGLCLFEKAIYSAFNSAMTNDVILLSPACASFDWFKNYEDRGKVFKAIVQKLKSEY